ncbi:GDSL esterase/lipase 2-like isoform X2 [Cornus florida]|uniref:GDSL esterase/lipase 2-like isoform X2 n=1 Tax=Cornus florida TaxID=4283 RepID=UPI00289D4FE1|nr:GDSL esterase/lipase 2-like isoform X2 [Cornus florida]
MAGLTFLSCVLVLVASLLLQGCYNYFVHTNDKHVTLFIFGDSFFDAGNNNYINTTTHFQANFWPYGETFFKYPTGRFSDGRLIPDFIAEYAKLPLIPPYLQPSNHRHYEFGANFASGGAGALVEIYPGMVVNLKTQLSYFDNVEKMLRRKVGEREAKQLLSNSIYLFSIGNNDYLSAVKTNSSFYHSYSQVEYVEMVIGNLTTVINEIYKKGGRKFGFLSLGPLGCSPSIRALNYSRNAGEEITSLVKLHNKALSKTLHRLERQLEGFMYSNFNFYTPFSERIDNPSKYGFKEGKSACCGTGSFRGVQTCGGKREVKEYELCNNASEYVFFDSSHPTELAYQQFASLMWSGPPDLARPYNLKALFAHI